MVKISVVVLNWNRKKDTLECLESLSRATLNDCRMLIVVVDNDSTDGSRAAVKRLLKVISRKRKNISYTLIKNKQNLGFAAGNNVGIRYSLAEKANYITVLNNDTLVDENIIMDLLQVAKEYPKAGILSPKIYFAPGYEFHKERYKNNEQGKVIWYAGGNLDWDNVYGVNNGVDEVDKGQFNKVKETDFATGACMFLRKSMVEQVGLFDEKYYMYMEDVDLSLRAKKAGWEVLFAPPGHIWHKVAQSSAIGSGLNDYFIHRSRMLFGMRYASLRTRFALYRESLRFILNGRKWQRQGVLDFYIGKFGKGSWNSKN